jgi:hypothetical protein
MAEKKISQLTAKSANLDATDLIPIAESDGLGGYVTKHITGAEVVGGAGSTTIYNGDAQLSGDRTIDCDSNFLKFAKLEYLYFQSNAVPSPSGTPFVDFFIDPSGAPTSDIFKIRDASTTAFKVQNDGTIEFNEAYTFPTADGTANQILTTDGAGAVTFEDATISKVANGNTIVEVTSSSDLPSTLAANTTYLIRGTISTSTQISVTNEGSQIIGYDRTKDKIEFTGTTGQTLLTITDVSFSISNVWLSATNTGSALIDATNVAASGYNNSRDSILAFVNVQFRNCFDVLDIKGFDLVDFNNCLFFYIEATNFGCRFQDVSKLEISSCEFIRWFDETTIPTPSGYATVPMIELQANNLASFGAVNINGCIIHPQQTQDGINISTSSTTGFGTIAANAFVNVGLTTGVVFNPTLSGLADYSQTATYNYDVFSNQGLLNSTSGAVMTVNNNTTNTTLTLNTPTVIDVGTLATAQAAVRYSVSTGGRLTYDGTKQKYVSMHVTIGFDKQGGGTSDYLFSLYKNGTLLAGSEVDVVTPSTLSNGTLALNYGTLMEQNDYVEVYVENVTDNSDMLVKDLQFVIRE